MKIVILGSGPAAVIAAVELVKLGHVVEVVGETRRFPVLEGISDRVYRALGYRGINQQVSAPVARTARWAGDKREVNTERLIRRPQFDEFLVGHLRSCDITCRDAYIRDVDIDLRQIILEDGIVDDADFIVDARGRAAGFQGRDRVRGPESVSLCAGFQSEPGAPFTLALSQPDGWMWVARDHGGFLFAQITRGGEPLKIAKQDIATEISHQLVEQEVVDAPLAGVEPGFARSSTPILVGNIIEQDYIRIGDAASAVDPLSGNGIFQSLSSALTAVPVINTMTRRPEDSEMARRFYRDRIEHLFYRFGRIGRDFYRSEHRWQDLPFWRARYDWPDNEPSHIEQDEIVGRAQKPVINNGFIEEKEVVITRDQPLGIWVDR